MNRSVWKHICFCLLILLLVPALTACSRNAITMDENGLAVWGAEKNAVKYECLFVDAEYVIAETLFVTEPRVQVPEGYSVHVRALYANGEGGDWMTSEYFGAEPAALQEEPAGEDVDPLLLVDLGYDLLWEDLKTYEVISSIRPDSVKTLEDGRVYFEAEGPKGGVMRFEGTNVTVTEGAITFAPGGRITALDAIGRIAAVEPDVLTPGAEGNELLYTGGYTFTDATSVESGEDLFYIWGFGASVSAPMEEGALPQSHMDFQPNFLAFGANAANEDAFTLSALTVYYDEATFCTGIRMLALEQSFYGTYLEGECYEPAREVYDSAANIYDFYLMAVPDVQNENEPYHPDPMQDLITPRSLIDFSSDRYTIGDLKDAAGNVLDKENAVLSPGSTLEITLGDYTMDLLVPVVERYTGARTYHDLVPYNNEYAQGEVMALVVPIFWQDQPEYATEETLNTLRSRLGRVMDGDGNVTDWSDSLGDSFSLSEYYDIASYGRYGITSYVTDWYAAPYNFADEMEDMVSNMDPFRDELRDWVFAAYPDMDWSAFDRNGDGFFDAVILVNTGVENDGEIIMATFSHAVHVSGGYTGEGTGLPGRPAMKNYINMNASFLSDATLIHEYAHGFGLVDYYDVTYSGIDAVGSYDMQSGSYGDWNAYSKYGVGWIEPTVVEGLESGQSVDITIGSFAKTGDAIVIPGAETDFDGPFGEYLLLDLFTADGVNEYAAADFGLEDAVGVRIYHVNAVMEKRVLTGEDGAEYPIGTVHFTNSYNGEGRYHIELVQAGGDNTFTDRENLRPRLAAEDLFGEGDVFTPERFGEFFPGGRMDDGTAFGYTVEILSLGADETGEITATVRVTRQ